MPALIRFLKDSEIVPNLIGIEHFEELLVKVIPAINAKEHDYF